MQAMEEQFDTAPIPRLVLRLGLPAMAAQFFNILYSIVDRIYVGNIPGDGSLALAGIGVCAPALTGILAFAYLVGIGGSASMSIFLGRRDKAKAQSMLDSAICLLLVISAAVTVLMLAVKRPLLYLLGCGDALYAFAGPYFTIYVCGTAAALCGAGLNLFLMAQGRARQGMLSVVIGALANVTLDPLFIFALGMGAPGAAVATVISQSLSLAYVLRSLSRKDLPIRLHTVRFRRESVLRILKIGTLPCFIMLLDNFIVIFLNASLRHYGGAGLGDQYIACAAVIQSFMTVVCCPEQGITSGCGTLFSYHYGARKFDRLMQAFFWVFALCSAYICLSYVLSQGCPALFVSLFLSDPGDAALAVSLLRVYTLGLIGVGVQYAVVDGLTAMGEVRFALPTTLFRKAVYVTMLIVLPLTGELRNIFWAQTIADLVGGSVTACLFLFLIRPKLRQELTAPAGRP